MSGCGLHACGSAQGPVVRRCEQGREHSNIGNIAASFLSVQYRQIMAEICHICKKLMLEHMCCCIGVFGRIILRWIFRKWDVGAWTGSSWLRIGTGGRHL